MICTRINEHIKTLIRDLEILWCAVLNDGTEVYSDYYIDDLPPPWIRLKEYCEKEKKYIKTIKCIMFGADPFIMFHDESGLDGIFVVRGMSKDIVINDDGIDNGLAYKHLIVGLLEDNMTDIHVKKFSWPENELEPYNQSRVLTNDNFSIMIFKNDGTRQKASEKLQIS